MLLQLPYAPETGKTDNCNNTRNYIVLQYQGNDNADNARRQKERPAFFAEIVFAFNNYRMKKTNNQKRTNPDNQTDKIH